MVSERDWVWSSIFGEKGDTGKKLLESGQDDFERNHLDTFVLQCMDIGAIKRISIGHDNSATPPATSNTIMSQFLRFYIHAKTYQFLRVFLAENQRFEGGHVLTVVRGGAEGLGAGWYCENVVVTAENLSTDFPLQAWFDDSHGDNKTERMVDAGAVIVAPTKYRVRVRTGNIRGAGTDADVIIVLFGANGSSGEQKLDSGRDDFERGPWNPPTLLCI